VFIEALVAKAAIKRLDIGILVRLPRLDETQVHTMTMGPGQHGLAGELLPVIRPDDGRPTTLRADPIEHPRKVVASKGMFRLDRHRLMGRVIHDHQALDGSAAGDPVKYKIHEPYLVGGAGTQQGLPIGHRNILAPSAADLQLLQPI